MSYGIAFSGADAMNSLVSLVTLSAISTLIVLVVGASVGTRLIELLARLFER